MWTSVRQFLQVFWVLQNNMPSPLLAHAPHTFTRSNLLHSKVGGGGWAGASRLNRKDAVLTSPFSGWVWLFLLVAPSARGSYFQAS